MNDGRTIASLAGLVRAREAEIDRIAADLARQEAIRRRHQNSLGALRALLDGAARPSGSASAAMAQNDWRYRQALRDTIARQRETLRMHEEDMQLSRQLLAAQMARCEIWRRELARRRCALATVRQRAEQRAQDALAVQVWWWASA